MIKTHEQNERNKLSYQTRLRHQGSLDHKTVDKAMSAIRQFEESTGCKPFKAFRIEQAIVFKEWLESARNQRTNKPLALATQHATLRAVRDFFNWLSDQPGFKSAIPRDGWQYFRPPRKDQRAAQRPSPRSVPTVEQVARAFDAMPAATSHHKRDKAVLAFLMLTGARIGAVASLRLKHVNLEARRVFQDPREVKTKHAKTINTTFFPMGEKYFDAVVHHINHLKADLLFGPDDPLFPKSDIRLGPNGFERKGLSRKPFAGSAPLTNIVKEAFATVQLPEYTPHAFRHMLARYGDQICPNREAFKAWSMNLGHDSIVTTVSSYMPVSEEAQHDIISRLGRSKK